jgi:very-short-patch-repair endonuclease
MNRNSFSSNIVDLCREQRKSPTEAEFVLWNHLRNRNLGGYKFRRQHPIGGYILDFYCAEAKTGIELDGAVHQDLE